MGVPSSKKFVKQQVDGFLIEEPALTTSSGSGDANAIPALNSSGILDDSIINASASKSANKVLKMNGSGIIDPSIVNGVVVSNGPADKEKFVQLDNAGLIDTSIIPADVGIDLANIAASEALSAGDFVNVWNDSGAKVRKADASSVGKEAHGFVLSAFASGDMAKVYFEGTNTSVVGVIPGPQFLSAVAGKSVNTPPSGAGNVIQRIGFGISSTAINFNSGLPVVLA